MKLVVGLLGVVASVAVLGVCPAGAQSAHALVLAEQACLDQHIAPNTADYNSCVGRVARAYDRGELVDSYKSPRRVRTTVARDTSSNADQMFSPQAGGYGPRATPAR
jgi:hypothetical protein